MSAPSCALSSRLVYIICDYAATTVGGRRVLELTSIWEAVNVLMCCIDEVDLTDPVVAQFVATHPQLASGLTLDDQVAIREFLIRVDPVNSRDTIDRIAARMVSGGLPRPARLPTLFALPPTALYALSPLPFAPE